jgi:hypothetical protein
VLPTGFFFRFAYQSDVYGLNGIVRWEDILFCNFWWRGGFERIANVYGFERWHCSDEFFGSYEISIGSKEISIGSYEISLGSC